MAVIPREVYSNVEWHLHNRASLVDLAVKQAQGAEDDAFYGSGVYVDNGSPRGTSKHGDPTALKAMKIIQAQRAIERARLWGFVADHAFEYFEGTRTGEIALAFYGQGVTILDVAASLGIDRQTVRYHRDTFVCTCALFASEKGLLRIESKRGEAKKRAANAGS